MPVVICKRNYSESCTCPPCTRERDRRRQESEGVTSITTVAEHPTADDTT